MRPAERVDVDSALPNMGRLTLTEAATVAEVLEEMESAVRAAQWDASIRFVLRKENCAEFCEILRRVL